MFVRKVPVRHGDTTYAYLRVVENVRQQGRVVQRTVLNMGNISRWESPRLAELVNTLTQFIGGATPVDGLTLDQVTYGESRVLGPYLPLAQLWAKLGMDGLLATAFAGKSDIPTMRACVKAMVFTQLVAPRSKLSTWARVRDRAEIPDLDGMDLPLHVYYRALTALADAKPALEMALHQQVRHLFNQDLTLVFYDLTSVAFEGTHCPLAKHGYSREHRPDLLQIEVGLLVDAEGLPIGHEIFNGNVKDVTTVLDTLKRLKERFHVTRCVFVGDDGMASAANLRAIGEAGYEYITSLSLGHSKVGAALLAAAPPRTQWAAQPDSTLQLQRLKTSNGVRYLGTYHPERAASNRSTRQRGLRKCMEALREWQAPPKEHERKRTPEQTLALADHFLRNKHCRGFFQLSLADNRLVWTLNRAAVRRARRKDGVLVLKTNSTTLMDEAVVFGYRTLWRAEDAFRNLKDDIHLRPIRHWSDSRVAGHVLVCVLAYLLSRLYERALEKAGLAMSTRSALEQLESLTVATLEAGGRRIRRRAEITPAQQRLLAAVGLKEVPAIW